VQIYPAIDIKGGRVLRAGAPGSGAAPAAGDPLAQAEDFVTRGASWIHVVDMDRALGTGGHNDEWVRRICSLGEVHVQVGGNVNTARWAEEAIAGGASRVVLGMGVVAAPALLTDIIGSVGRGAAAVAVDVRDGRPALRGEDEPFALEMSDVIQRVREGGVETVVHRDLERDGSLAGADLAAAASLSRLGLAVIAAGGVAGAAELTEARDLGLGGVVVGRALYEGRFTLEEAIACSA
jgi:phosphoribosylformimino-5-aminoimidazole carboxamide ribonucleotide (ProFAR) isomerase